MPWQPKPAGPRDLRSMFHWVYRQLQDIGRQVDSAVVENVGGGAGIAAPPVAQGDNRTFPFKTLLGGNSITITEQAETVTIASNAVIITETAINASSFADQLPTALGAALKLTFGAPQTNPNFSLDAAGNFTCLTTDEYTLFSKFVVGRRGSAAGIAQVYIRFLVNGVQGGGSSHTIIDNPDVEIPISFSFTIGLTAGDVITFEIVRDTDGNNSGGVYAGNPEVVGWNPSPSCTVDFSRTLAVEV